MALLDTYSGGGINPAQDEAGAITQAVTLAAAKYFPQGTVLGQILGSGSDVNEVQTLTGTGTISGGTYIIVYDGQMTTALAFNANAATIQAALEALSYIGTGGVTVGGGPVSSTPVTLTFAGSGTTGGKHHPLVSVINSLTGTTPVVTPTLTTLGRPANGYWDSYDDAASGSQAGLNVARALNKFDVRTDSNGRVYGGQSVGAADNRNWQRTATVYTSGTFATGTGAALALPGLDANGAADLGRFITGTSAALTSDKTLLRIG